MTHSYTVQPVISADGRLLPKLFVVLQEKDGKFGERVKKEIFKADNLYVLPSKSGKLTKSIVQAWIEDVYLPNVPNDSVLLLDSWTG